MDAGALVGTVDLPGTSLTQGLRVSVSAASALTGLAATHDLVEGTPSAILVGYSVWTEGASPSTADASWTGARVRVEWLVSLHGRSSCSVDLEAVPRVVPASGCPALLEEFRLHRTLDLGESLVIATDPAHRPTPAALALVGSQDGRAGRFVIRVRR